MAPKRPAGADAFPKLPVEPSDTRQSEEGALYAALDLGTNSCRMLIARPRGNQFQVIDSFSKPVQLGLGLEASGRLSRSSMARTVHALQVCRRKLEQHRVRNMRLVATEACRRARNSRDFLRTIRRETGLPVEIIDAEEEARLAVDIGGGSTELVWIDLEDVAPKERPRAIMRLSDGFANPIPGGARVVDWISVPLGVATLRDQFADVEDDQGRFALMSWYFEELLADFAPYADGSPDEGFQIIGTSGTVTTVAASHLGLRRYDRTKVDGLEMTTEQIDRVIHSYLALGPDGRRSDPRIGRERHALIMSGAAILQTLMRVWPTSRLSVADRGLREGLLYAQMVRDGVLTPDGVNGVA